MSDLATRPNIDIELARLDKLAKNLDAIVRIPGTRLTLGLDSILGLVPVIGDTLALAPSLYVILESRRLGASPHAVGRMCFNVGIDYVVGLVPIVGDIFDFGWQANLRNTAILREELDHQDEKAALKTQRGFET